MIHKFTINKNGRLYDCEREVSGVDVQQQRITVVGVASTVDPSRYGKKTKSGGTMEVVARIIANRIIDESV